MAFDNFDVLANKIAEPKYLEIKTIEKNIETKFPEQFWSKYRMIFFGDKSYDQIL